MHTLKKKKILESYHSKNTRLIPSDATARMDFLGFDVQENQIALRALGIAYCLSTVNHTSQSLYVCERMYMEEGRFPPSFPQSV